MCGIVGIRENNKNKVKVMLSVIDHRGPDYASTWSNEKITLGHNLLSIRSDYDRSRQPVSDNIWHLSFNGQIYNTEEIKKLLPNTHKDEELDTKLLFALIQKYNWNFIEHIQGMFAIALYNEKEDELRLYRDQTGQKNLYYTTSNPFTFASEIDSILEVTDIKRESDTVAVQTALSIGYIPGSKTLFKDIRKLSPGQMLIKKGEGIPNSHFYKSASNEFENKTPEEVLQSTVEKHLASKRKVAINLSGGLDSSLILHEMKGLGCSLHSYTTRFISNDEKLNEDADLAKILSEDYQTDHHELEITSDIYKNNLIRAAEIIEEPNYNISLPTYLEVAKTEGINGDKNRVILSGDGGDEVFGGYPMYQKSLKYQKAGPLLNPYKLFRDKTFWNYQDPVEKWLRFKFFFFNSVEKETVLSYLEKELPPEWHNRDKDPVRDMMLLDRYFWLSGENFIRSDKLYMSESLELRSPLSYQPLRNYFDKKLTEKEYFNGNENKHYLRKLYMNKLPDYITKRENKTGWRSPIATWWNKEYKAIFTQAFSEAPKSDIINWQQLIEDMDKKDSWPGKKYHLYFSLAVLSKKYNLPL